MLGKHTYMFVPYFLNETLQHGVLQVIMETPYYSFKFLHS